MNEEETRILELVKQAVAKEAGLSSIDNLSPVTVLGNYVPEKWALYDGVNVLGLNPTQINRVMDDIETQVGATFDRALRPSEGIVTLIGIGNLAKATLDLTVRPDVFLSNPDSAGLPQGQNIAP